MHPDLAIDEVTLRNFCVRHHIRRLSLFGSRSKGTAQAESDIDLLVEFETGASPGYLDMAGMEIELSSQLGGRRVDLRTAAELSHHFRDEVVRDALPQYVA